MRKWATALVVAALVTSAGCSGAEKNSEGPVILASPAVQAPDLFVPRLDHPRSAQFHLDPDAILSHAGVETYYWASGSRTPVNRAAAVTRALAAATSKSDVVTLGAGDYDLGEGIANGGPLFVGCELRGQGMGVTRFLNKKRIYDYPTVDNIQSAFGPAIACKDGAYLHDFSVIGSLPMEDGYKSNNSSCGFDNKTTNATATLRRIEMYATDWTFYCWTNGCNYTLDQCLISGGRLLVAQVGSSAPLCNGTITNCTFTGLPDSSIGTGDVSAQMSGACMGVCVRGGSVSISNCNFNMHGLVGLGPDINGYWYTGVDSWCPRIIGISDKIPYDGTPYVYDPASPNAITVNNCGFSYSPNNPTHDRAHWDIDLQYAWTQAALMMNNCRGSGPGNSVRRSW
jgi:hypothetical protein